MLSRIVAIFWLFFGLQALAQDCTPYVYRTAETAGDLPDAGSFLLEVAVADAPSSYILGTLHSAEAELVAQWSAAALLMASASPRVFISERNLKTAIDPQLQLLPEPETLKVLLADQPGLFDRVVALMQRYGLADAASERFKPWFAAALLSQAPAMPRHRGEKIIDEVLSEAAATLDIPTRALETFADIADVYEGNFSQQEQIRLLWEAVCNQELLGGLVEAQTRAFAANDVAGLYQLLNRYEGADQGLSDKLTDVFVERRNTVFWRQLWPEIRHGGAFIVVGSLHVFGENGLLERLREAGEKVTVRPVDTAALIFGLDPERLGGLQSWALDWAHGQGIGVTASVFEALQLEHQPVAALRQGLCPGRPCQVEATYAAPDQAILIADPFFARLLAAPAHGAAYADSVLLRELIRHLLYQTVADRLRSKLSGEKRAAACLRSSFLHWASQAQLRYLRESNAAATAHLFPLDPRCPVLSLPARV